jgi:phosphonate transport system substrate-binding protein
MPQGMPKLTFGLVPVTDDARTRIHLSDLCALLSEAVGGVITPHRAHSPLALASAVQSGRVQLAWLSPTLLVTAAGLSSILPLVSSVREGVTSYHAALFVDASSPFWSVQQLAAARARVAWLAPTSASGYLFPRAALRRRGLDPRKLFSAETFHDTHGGVAEAVLRGKADVGATFAVYEGGDPTRRLARAGFLGVVPGRTGRVIEVAGPIPADIIASVPGVPVWARAALTVALQRIADHPAAREPLKALFGVERFAPFSAAALPGLRALVDLGRETAPAAAPV